MRSHREKLSRCSLQLEKPRRFLFLLQAQQCFPHGVLSRARYKTITNYLVKTKSDGAKYNRHQIGYMERLDREVATKPSRTEFVHKPLRESSRIVSEFEKLARSRQASLKCRTCEICSEVLPQDSDGRIARFHLMRDELRRFEVHPQWATRRATKARARLSGDRHRTGSRIVGLAREDTARNQHLSVHLDGALVGRL